MEITKTLKINAILIFIILLIFEIIFRFIPQVNVSPITKGLYKFNKYYGWTFSPNLKKNYYNPLKNTIKIQINSDGFRDEEIVRDFKKKRILFIGDSATAALQVNKKERFSEILSNKLNYEGFNLGINGFATDQSLAVLKKYIREIKPDIIIYTLVENDFYPNGEKFLQSGFGDQWSKSYYDENLNLIYAKNFYLNNYEKEKEKKIIVKFKNFLKKNSSIIRALSKLKVFIKDKIKGFKIKDFEIKNLDTSFFDTPSFDYLFFDTNEKIKKFELFKKLVLEMKNEAEKNDSVLVVSRSINQIDLSKKLQDRANKISNNVNNVDDVYEEYTSKLKLFFKKNEILYLPVSEYKINPQLKFKIFFYNKSKRFLDGHYTAFGHKYVANKMHEFIKDNIK